MQDLCRCARRRRYCETSVRLETFRGNVACGGLAPVRERYAEIRADERRLEETLAAGAEKARAIASETLRDVRERMGVGPPS